MSDGSKRESLIQLLKFGLIGILNTAVDMTVFGVLIISGIHYAAAQIAAYSAGMAGSYLMNSKFTFHVTDVRGDRKQEWRRRLQFLMWNVTMLGLSVLLLASVKRWFGWKDLIAKTMVTVLIVAINFYGSKKWVFAGERQAEKGGRA